MEKKLSGTTSFRDRGWRGLGAVVMSLLFVLALTGKAFGQNLPIAASRSSGMPAERLAGRN